MTTRQTFLRFFAVAALAIGLASAGQAAAKSPDDIVVKASLDSAVLEMGRTTALHVEVFGTLDSSDTTAMEVMMEIPDSLAPFIEIAGVTDPVVSDLGNGRARFLRDIIIQSFDSGAYTLPPVIFRTPDSAFRSNQCVIKVYPTDLDSLTTIHDYAGPVSVKRHLLDYLPDWMAKYGLWIILSLIVIAVTAFIVIKKLNGATILPKAPEKREDPVDAALRQLGELRQENLCQRGEEKTYYTRLTDILRTYLHDRFGINAMEMTSTEIRHAVASNATTNPSRHTIDAILEMADFVKFAKVRPLPDDNVAAMNRAVTFVDETRPVEIPAPTAEDDGFEDKDGLEPPAPLPHKPNAPQGKS